MAQKIPFFELFPTLTLPWKERVALGEAYLTAVEVERERREMIMDLVTQRDLGEGRGAVESALAQAYDLHKVEIRQRVEAPAQSAGGKAKGEGEVVMGSPIRGQVQPMEGLNPKMGNVIVAGRVFFADLYETRRPGVFCLTFDMTDFQSSVPGDQVPAEGGEGRAEDGHQARHVAEGPGLYQAQPGRQRRAAGPQEYQHLPRTMRQDTAEVKRVELHLHTSFSNMDATSPLGPKNGPDANIVKRAEAWGHPAVAITDHGVVQGFPDAQHSAKNIKLIYGMEGYFVNNLDDRIVVHGDKDFSFTDEYVAFDIETTGLR